MNLMVKLIPNPMVSGNICGMHMQCIVHRVSLMNSGPRPMLPHEQFYENNASGLPYILQSRVR